MAPRACVRCTRERRQFGRVRTTRACAAQGSWHRPSIRNEARTWPRESAAHTPRTLGLKRCDLGATIDLGLEWQSTSGFLVRGEELARLFSRSRAVRHRVTTFAFRASPFLSIQPPQLQQEPNTWRFSLGIGTLQQRWTAPSRKSVRTDSELAQPCTIPPFRRTTKGEFCPTSTTPGIWRTARLGWPSEAEGNSSQRTVLAR